MSKWLTCLGVILLLQGSIQTGDTPGDPLAKEVKKRQEDKEAFAKFVKSFSELIRIRQSKPVTVNEAKFVVVAQTDWYPGKPSNAFRTVAPLTIQLYITNLSKREVLFPTFQAFGLKIFKEDGQEVKPRSVLKKTNFTRPYSLPTGVSYTLCPQTELRWDEKTKASELVLYDGTGSQSVIGPLAPGRYKLVFWYSPPGMGEKQKVGDAVSWSGKVTTKEVFVAVHESLTRGFPSAYEQSAGGFTEPLQIRESKPVTVNNAKFVVVAQANWKPGKTGKEVPIDIQLRITNLSKNDLIFPTFDTSGVRLLSASGKKLMYSGGRDATSFTRPVLVPAGATYSLAVEGGPPSTAHRRAELFWDLKTKAAEMVYYDGTGSARIVGPLEPGRYKLAFGYAVETKGPLKTEREPATWFGEVVTEDIVIEVLNR